MEMQKENRANQLKLKKQRKAAKKLAEEKENQADQLLEMGQKFSSLEEEVNVSRQIIKKWKFKHE